MKIFAQIISDLKRRPDLFAAIIGLLAGLIVLSWLQGRERAMTQRAGSANVVCARNEIIEGKVISLPDVMMRKVPSEFLDADSILKPNDVVGSVAKISMLAGSVLTKQKIAAIDNTNSMRALVPAGMKAVILPQQKQLNYSKLFRVGDVVDVVGVSKKDGRENVAELLSEDAIILSSGDVNVKTTTAAGAFSGAALSDSLKPVVIAVGDASALKINEAMAKGDVFLNLSSKF